MTLWPFSRGISSKILMSPSPLSVTYLLILASPILASSSLKKLRSQNLLFYIIKYFRGRNIVSKQNQNTKNRTKFRSDRIKPEFRSVSLEIFRIQLFYLYLVFHNPKISIAILYIMINYLYYK